MSHICICIWDPHIWSKCTCLFEKIGLNICECLLNWCFLCQTLCCIVALIPAKMPRRGGGRRPSPSQGVLAELKWGYIRFKLGFFPTYRWRRIFSLSIYYWYSIFENIENPRKILIFAISELCEENYKIISLKASSGVYLSVDKQFWPRDYTWAAGHTIKNK